MEDKTRNIIIALVIIGALVGVGIPLGAVLLAPPYGAVQTGVLVTPGAPAGVSEDQIIKVGCLSAMTEIQGEGAWKGAFLAMDEINSAGGINIGGATYYFGLVAEDTYEADPNLDVTRGVAAAELMLESHDPDFTFGGFRTEALLAYQESVMDAQKIFINVGAATDAFCTNVLTNYARYKYFFRIMPINSTSLVKEILTFIGYLKVVMEARLGRSVTKAAVIREDLDWTIGMGLILDGAYAAYGIPGLPQLGFDVVEHIAYPITASAEDFATYWQTIESEGAQLVVPVISAQGGILMTSQYAQIQPGCLIYGIDVMSQESTYWDETNGGCEHEIVMGSLVEDCHLTELSMVYWNAYESAFGSTPLYTATGGYNAINLLYNAIVDAQSFDTDDIITQMESYDRHNTVAGVTGNLAFTGSHDVQEGYDPVTGVINGVAVMGQWQAPGKRVALSSGGLIYPDETPAGAVVTGTLTLPDWDDDGTPDIN